MSIKYDRIDFLEFLDEENIVDQKNNSVEYIITYENGERLVLRLFLNDEKATMKLYEKDIEQPLFDVDIHEIKKITCDKSLIRFYKDAVNWYAEPFFKVVIRPFVSWQHEM